VQASGDHCVRADQGEVSVVFDLVECLSIAVELAVII
jgi:hypothetical protein